MTALWRRFTCWSRSCSPASQLAKTKRIPRPQAANGLIGMLTDGGPGGVSPPGTSGTVRARSWGRAIAAPPWRVAAGIQARGFCPRGAACDYPQSPRPRLPKVIAAKPTPQGGEPIPTPLPPDAKFPAFAAAEAPKARPPANPALISEPTQSYSPGGMTMPSTRGSRSHLTLLPSSDMGGIGFGAASDGRGAAVEYEPMGPTSRGGVRGKEGGVGVAPCLLPLRLIFLRPKATDPQLELCAGFSRPARQPGSLRAKTRPTCRSCAGQLARPARRPHPPSPRRAGSSQAVAQPCCSPHRRPRRGQGQRRAHEAGGGRCRDAARAAAGGARGRRAAGRCLRHCRVQRQQRQQHRHPFGRLL